MKTTKTEWYRRAFAMLDLVLLEEFESPQDNQIEILASCEALFDDQVKQGNCAVYRSVIMPIFTKKFLL